MSNQPASQQAEETGPVEESAVNEIEQFVEMLNAMNNRIHDLMRAYEVSSHAINRMEQFTFSLMRLTVESGTCSYEDIFRLAKTVQSEKTLFDFFGLTEEEMQSFFADEASEVENEENNT